MSQTRKYSTVTVLFGASSVVLANVIEDANDRGQRVLVGRRTGGNFDEAQYPTGCELEIGIGSVPVRKIADGLFTVVFYDADTYSPQY